MMIDYMLIKFIPLKYSIEERFQANSYQATIIKEFSFF